MAVPIAAKEFALIQEIGRGTPRTQRELSSRAGLSLGMTNILLKRLDRKGYIKARPLESRGTRYLLTLKGSAEMARKGYADALRAWRQARRIVASIQERIIAEYRGGAHRAAVVAWPETVDLIRQALQEKDLPGLSLDFLESFQELGERPGVVFLATVEPPPAAKPGQRFVPLLDPSHLEFRFDSQGGRP